VAILDPSPEHLGNQLRQLTDVINSNASPGEAVVAMFLAPSFGQTYVVRPGDSLNSIAIAHGLALRALEAANPQLGPLSGRDWKLIHPNERVTIPNGAPTDALLVVSRAPAGPPPPELIRLPQRPSNPTDFQLAQYEHAVASANTVNAERVARWRTEADKSVQSWQKQVVDQLEKKAASRLPDTLTPSQSMVSSSLNAGVTTLQGLTGRHVLLFLGGADNGPGTLAKGSLANVHLVIANLADSQTSAAWSAAGTAAGAASVNALDPALTRLKLAQVVNHNS
jgi:LysM repeat protein